MANVYKYYNNGFLSISGIYGITCFTHYIEGYYYNTRVIHINAYFEKEKPNENHITIEIDDGGYHSSPFTTKMLKRMLNDILSDIDVDNGSEWENNAYDELYRAIRKAFELYFNKYRKSECQVHRDTRSNQIFYFNF